MADPCTDYDTGMNTPVNREDLAIVAAHNVRVLYGDTAGFRTLVRDLGVRATARALEVSHNRVQRLIDRLDDQDRFDRAPIGDLTRVSAACGFRLELVPDL